MTMIRALLLIPLLWTPAYALVPRATCLSQCATMIQTDCVNKHAHVKPACKARIIRRCRHGKLVCPLPTTTTTIVSSTTIPGQTTTTGAGETTTTVTSSTTTTTSVGGGAQYTMKFTNAPPTGPCGSTDQPTVLHCGGLSIGGGGSIVPEGPTPPGSASLYHLDCALPSGGPCAVSATKTAPTGIDADCTDSGCFFGTPLPVANTTVPPLSTCVVNTLSKPVTGTLDLDTGDATLNVSLNSHVFLTGNSTQPCSLCKAGHCDRGSKQGAACQSSNPQGLTRDCPPGGGLETDLGIIAVDLCPLSTGTASKTAADGLFCNPQRLAGCFGSAVHFPPLPCTEITEHGVPRDSATGAITLGSVFCIPETSSGP